jgi:hypothetical protein
VCAATRQGLIGRRHLTRPPYCLGPDLPTPDPVTLYAGRAWWNAALKLYIRCRQGLVECRARRVALTLCDPAGVARLVAAAALDR